KVWIVPAEMGQALHGVGSAFEHIRDEVVRAPRDVVTAGGSLARVRVEQVRLSPRHDVFAISSCGPWCSSRGGGRCVCEAGTDGNLGGRDHPLAGLAAGESSRSVRSRVAVWGHASGASSAQQRYAPVWSPWA